MAAVEDKIDMDLGEFLCPAMCIAPALFDCCLVNDFRHSHKRGFGGRSRLAVVCELLVPRGVAKLVQRFGDACER
jgi:hypothetical protein